LSILLSFKTAREIGPGGGEGRVVPICVKKDGGDKSTELDNVIYLFFYLAVQENISSPLRDKNVLIKFLVNFVKFHPRGWGGYVSLN
jgi:hypothetical protein